MPFNVLFRDVADADLGPLLTRAADLGYASPSVTSVAGRHGHQLDGTTGPGNDLVTGWELVDHREGQVYQWPETLEHYDRYDVYRGETQREGTVFFRGVDADYATQRDVSRTKRDIKTFEIRLRCDNSDLALAVGMTAYVALPLGGQ